MWENFWNEIFTLPFIQMWPNGLAPPPHGFGDADSGGTSNIIAVI